MYSDLKGVEPTAIYDLNTVFDAVAAGKDKALDLIQKYPDAGPIYYSHTVEASEKHMSTLASWRDAGATHILAAAPLSDSYGNLGTPGNSFLEQMKKGQIQPVDITSLPAVD